MKKHIAIIGGGAAGLCAARHITAPGSGMTCVLYEQTDNLGGTWVYTDNIGKDKYGMPIHSSMFKNLRTNIPKEIMTFPGFPYKQEESYVTANDVVSYLVAYADRYDIKDHVKFHHHVTRVSPLDSGWEVAARNLESNKESVERFDAVILCNGHHTVPVIPDIKGLDVFQGKVIHSRYYRTPEEFLGKSVLVIGGGQSGIDIILDISKFATKIYFAYHSLPLSKNVFPANVQHLPDVTQMSETEVIFEDNSSFPVDVVLLCTGYKFSFPFLTPECGLVVEQENMVRPLYKHLIHALKPSLCIMGLVSVLFPVFDVQIQFFLKTLSGTVQLPSSADMLDELTKDLLQKQKHGFVLKNYHKLEPGNIKLYADTLTKLSHFPPLPHVLFRIYESCLKDKTQSITGYREIEYRITDDVKYTRNGILVE